MCLVNCPFGAIVDKGQIFQMIQAMKEGHRVYAAVAPAFVGQFGPKVTPGKLRSAMKALGFTDVIEVAVGADLCATDEAKDFMENVPDKLPFMATSCCPAWSVMAKKLFPEFKDCVSMTLTPMVLTGRLIKLKDPEAKVVFIGPCAAKKLEASRKSVRKMCIRDSCRSAHRRTKQEHRYGNRSYTKSKRNADTYREPIRKGMILCIHFFVTLLH